MNVGAIGAGVYAGAIGAGAACCGGIGGAGGGACGIGGAGGAGRGIVAPIGNVPAKGFCAPIGSVAPKFGRGGAAWGIEPDDGRGGGGGGACGADAIGPRGETGIGVRDDDHATTAEGDDGVCIAAGTATRADFDDSAATASATSRFRSLARSARNSATRRATSAPDACGRIASSARCISSAVA